ncbi:hypothetical protein J1605_017265 [Eschrichtius robustus]|uniref:Coiled-coil domain-containing protein 187 n=1 Tax=Eschrichtius robustus TaxID=9764 RepID=A0AB34I2B1_ESCRO|nr:hypothetical protein J1605_017265 [Eschrichtius robustus]
MALPPGALLGSALLCGSSLGLSPSMCGAGVGWTENRALQVRPEQSPNPCPAREQPQIKPAPPYGAGWSRPSHKGGSEACGVSGLRKARGQLEAPGFPLGGQAMPSVAAGRWYSASGDRQPRLDAMKAQGPIFQKKQLLSQFCLQGGGEFKCKQRGQLPAVVGQGGSGPQTRRPHTQAGPHRLRSGLRPWVPDHSPITENTPVLVLILIATPSAEAERGQAAQPPLFVVSSGLLSDIRQKSLSFLESLKLDEWKPAPAPALALVGQQAELEVSMKPHCNPPASHPPEPVQERKPDQSPSRLPLARLHPWDNPILQWSQTRPQGPAPAQFSHFTLQMLEQRLREEELRAQHQAALLRLREKALEEKTRAELAWLEHRRGYLNSTGSYAALMASAEKQHQALSNLERELREIRFLRNIQLFSRQEKKLLLQHQKDVPSLQRSTALSRQELQARSRLPQDSLQEGAPGLPDSSAPLPAPAQGPGRPQARTPQLWASCLHLTGTVSNRLWGSCESRAPCSSQVPTLGSALSTVPPAALPRLLPSSSPDVKAAREEGPGTSQQPEGPAQASSRPPRTPTPHRPGSPGSHRPRRSPENPQVPHLLTEQEDRTPPWAASAEDSHLQPPRLAWGEDTPVGSGRPDAGGQLAESHGHMGQGNQAGQQQWQPRTDATPSVGPGSSRQHQAQGQTDLRPEFRDPVSSASCVLRLSALTASVPPRRPPDQAQPPASKGEDPGSDRKPSIKLPGPEPTLTKRRGSPQPPGSQCESVDPFQLDLSVDSYGTRTDVQQRGPHPDRGISPKCFQQVVEGSGSRAGSELGLGFASSPVEEPVTVESCSGEQRVETSWQEDPRAPSSLQKAAQLTASPAAAAAKVVAPPAQHEGSPLAQLMEPLDLGSESESGPSTCSGTSGSSARSPTPCSGSSPSCPSLQEFQKASAILVQLSESSVSLSDGEAGDTPGADLSRSGGLSAGGSWGFHWGGGPETWEGLKGSGALSLRGSCAGAGGPEPAGGLPSTPSPRSGSELSEASSEVWDPEGLREPALTAESRAPGCGESRAPSVLEEACPPLARGVLTEILSPVREVLSYGSADLPSSTHWDTRLPPPLPILPADSEADPARAHSEDFPSPPEDAECPGGSWRTPGEDTPIITGELPSLSEEGPPEPLSPGPQESGFCLGVAGQGRSLGDELGLRADLPGVERAEVVDLVSTQLTRRILCDTLAELSEAAWQRRGRATLQSSHLRMAI